MTLFLQGIFLTQGWNLDLLPCRQILYHLTLLYLSCRHYFSFVFIFWKQITNALFLKIQCYHIIIVLYLIWIWNIPILILFFSLKLLCAVTKSFLTLCNTMNYSMPGFPVLHHLLEFARTHVHWVYDATQQSNPLSPPSQSFSPSKSVLMSHLFASGGQSIEASASASVLPVNIEDWFTLGLTELIFLKSKWLSRVFSSTIQKYQFLNTQPSLWPNSHIHTWLWETIPIWTFVSKATVSVF